MVLSRIASTVSLCEGMSAAPKNMDEDGIVQRDSLSVSSKDDLGYYSDQAQFSIGSADFANGVDVSSQTFVNGRLYEYLYGFFLISFFLGTESQFQFDDIVRRTLPSSHGIDNPSSDCVFVGIVLTLDSLLQISLCTIRRVPSRFSKTKCSGVFLDA